MKNSASFVPEKIRTRYAIQSTGFYPIASTRLVTISFLRFKKILLSLCHQVVSSYLKALNTISRRLKARKASTFVGLRRLRKSARIRGQRLSLLFEKRTPKSLSPLIRRARTARLTPDSLRNPHQTLPTNISHSKITPCSRKFSGARWSTISALILTSTSTCGRVSAGAIQTFLSLRVKLKLRILKLQRTFNYCLVQISGLAKTLPCWVGCSLKKTSSLSTMKPMALGSRSTNSKRSMIVSQKSENGRLPLTLKDQIQSRIFDKKASMSEMLLRVQGQLMMELCSCGVSRKLSSIPGAAGQSITSLIT